jgi:hypothetical protein
MGHTKQQFTSVSWRPPIRNSLVLVLTAPPRFSRPRVVRGQTGKYRLMQVDHGQTTANGLVASGWRPPFQAGYARAEDIAETDKVFASALAEYRLPRLVGKRTVPSGSRLRSGGDPPLRSNQPCVRHPGNRDPLGRWRPGATPTPNRQHPIKPIGFRRRRPSRSSISPVKPRSSPGGFSTTRTPRPSETPCVQPRV